MVNRCALTASCHLANPRSQHWEHPYPSKAEKRLLSQQAEIEFAQVTNWFVNARARIWKPIVQQSGQRDLTAGRSGRSGRARGRGATKGASPARARNPRSRRGAARSARAAGEAAAATPPRGAGAWNTNGAHASGAAGDGTARRFVCSSLGGRGKAANALRVAHPRCRFVRTVKRWLCRRSGKWRRRPRLCRGVRRRTVSGLRAAAQPRCVAVPRHSLVVCRWYGGFVSYGGLSGVCRALVQRTQAHAHDSLAEVAKLIEEEGWMHELLQHKTKVS